MEKHVAQCYTVSNSFFSSFLAVATPTVNSVHRFRGTSFPSRPQPRGFRIFWQLSANILPRFFKTAAANGLGSSGEAFGQSTVAQPFARFANDEVPLKGGAGIHFVGLNVIMPQDSLIAGELIVGQLLSDELV